MQVKFGESWAAHPGLSTVNKGKWTWKWIHLLSPVMSPKADKVSFNLVGEMACDVASLCRQTTPIDASLDCRVWQASMNGVTKCGRRMRSDSPLAYSLTNGCRAGDKPAVICASEVEGNPFKSFSDCSAAYIDSSVVASNIPFRLFTFLRSEYLRFDSCIRFESSVCKIWEDISNHAYCSYNISCESASSPSQRLAIEAQGSIRALSSYAEFWWYETNKHAISKTSRLSRRFETPSIIHENLYKQQREYTWSVSLLGDGVSPSLRIPRHKE